GRCDRAHAADGGAVRSARRARELRLSGSHRHPDERRRLPPVGAYRADAARDPARARRGAARDRRRGGIPAVRRRRARDRTGAGGRRRIDRPMRRTPMSFDVPRHIRPLRARVRQFIEERIYPVEQVLDRGDGEARAVLRELMVAAKAESLWALGHPKEIGGGGLPFLDYVYVNEVVGRSQHAMVALGTHSLQDSIMLNLYASPEWRDRYLAPLVAGEVFPSFAMTEPEVASSDPTQLQTRAVLDGDHWVITGRKWFTTGARNAAYTTVMVRTEFDAPPHRAFSMIVVPTDTPGYDIVRETPVLGLMGGHCEVAYNDVRVPRSNLLGERGQGFLIAQQRLGPGRIFHCMRWLGQAQRAFDLMCARANSRVAFGGPLAEKQ